ncbi:hypothetical protein [Arthrobacter sp. UYEF21]|uniref:hypothetical protein n=1 Tax=Arthrobacter sp. UYEF21 TaxID=1756364 RepID=UPI0033921987
MKSSAHLVDAAANGYKFRTPEAQKWSAAGHWWSHSGHNWDFPHRYPASRSQLAHFGADVGDYLTSQSEADQPWADLGQNVPEWSELIPGIEA